MLFAPSEDGVAWAQGQNNCQACPGTHFCPCINCSRCNSGGFALQCYCFRGTQGQEPVNVCTGGDGHCAGACAQCVERNVKTGRTCTSYAGCPGQLCPSGVCNPPVRALATAPCEDCQISELEDRSGPLTIRVRLERPDAIPIDLLDLVTVDDRKEIRIRNNHKAGLVTLLLGVTHRAHNGEVTSSLVKADSWHMDAPFLGPGSVDTVPQMKRATHPSGIASVQIRPVYAEFEDGTRSGNTDSLLCLSRERKALMTAMDAARVAIEQRGSTRAAVTRVLQDDNQLGFLQTDLDRGGVEAVLARLRSPRRFQP